MFESASGSTATGLAPAAPLRSNGLRAADLETLVARLAELATDVTDAERIDQLRALERLKNAAAAAQARIAVAFDASQRAEQQAVGDPTVRPGVGIAAQVALARRESPHRGGRHLGLAKALVHEMPHLLRAMERGLVSEWAATLVGRETACLDRADRTAIDAELFADPARTEGLGDKRLVAEVRKLAYQRDPKSVVDRASQAASDRRVTIRPAPDTMCYLTALLPVAQGVAAYAALTRAADSARAAGDGRGKGQVMADTLVSLVTGQETADAIPVSVGVLMTDTALLGGSHEPAHLEGHGPIPASVARELVALSPRDRTWVRRLYTSPATGQLVAMDARGRRFPKGLVRLVRNRDQFCRTPWCGAPIRHLDHPDPHAGGGPTSATNGQGLCEACNHNKQAPGWRALPRPGPDHVVETTTPTGHGYRSRAPALGEPLWREIEPGVWTRVA